MGPLQLFLGAIWSHRQALMVGATFVPPLVKTYSLVPTQLHSAALPAFRLPGDSPALASVSPSVK